MKLPKALRSLGIKGDIDIVKLLLILLILGFFGMLPFWGYSHSYGVFPSGVLGLLLLIVVLKVLGVI